MALPKRKKAQFTVTLPSSKQKIKACAFDVSDELILAQAKDSNDVNAIIDAILQVTAGCVEGQNINVEELPSVDVEYLFIVVRSKSVGENIELTYKFEDGEEVPVEIDIDKIRVDYTSCIQPQIKLDDSTMIVMKYPSMNEYREEEEEQEKSKYSRTIEYCARCVDQIVLEDEVYQRSDMSLQDIILWLEGLSLAEFEKVSDFVTNLPVMAYDVKIKHPKTKETHTIALRGLQDFF